MSPKKLYKYYNFDPKGHSINSVKDQSIYFSDPLTFNDIFDSKPDLINTVIRNDDELKEVKERISKKLGFRKDRSAKPT